ncbi:hypothetical protein AciM339_0945 [Aciduliprofundum sp. MAR08-339]|uniref:hypothetical protein n=1 Tax=Aciduliprofundum sp. (strain MAR08-339) TaxID=673860 RepID=UPI0002A4CBE4|nr:hypothetical protein AciM339_0945 [Aciduliprofundum sp. MAR08-339]
MEGKKYEEENDERDVEEFKEVMNTLRETLPALIKEIVEALYSSQNAEEFGKQVANFYKSMVEAGMSEDQAFQLTQEYMRSRDVSTLINKVMGEGKYFSHRKEKNVEIEEEDVKREE